MRHAEEPTVPDSDTHGKARTVVSTDRRSAGARDAGPVDAGPILTAVGGAAYEWTIADDRLRWHQGAEQVPFAADHPLLAVVPADDSPILVQHAGSSPTNGHLDSRELVHTGGIVRAQKPSCLARAGVSALGIPAGAMSAIAFTTSAVLGL